MTNQDKDAICELWIAIFGTQEGAGYNCPQGAYDFAQVVMAYEREKQAEQEPMYISESCAQRGCACHYSVAVDGEPVTVYAAPVRTKDLTDDEIVLLAKQTNGIYYDCDCVFARAVIAADREKNK